MDNVFSVGFGTQKRKEYVFRLALTEPTIAFILSAVVFELTLKRFILKMGKSNTTELKERLEKTWSFPALKKIWQEEIGSKYNNVSIKGVLTNFSSVMEHSKDPKDPNACDVRGQIIHGNGTVGAKLIDKSMRDYLFASERLYEFAKRYHKCDLDKRLATRK